MTVKRTIYRDKALSPDTDEFLNVTLSCSTAGVVLDQDVAFTFDRVTYYPANWIGDPGPIRTAQLLMTDANLPTQKTNTVYVRVTDNPEQPILNAGTLVVL